MAAMYTPSGKEELAKKYPHLRDQIFKTKKKGKGKKKPKKRAVKKVKKSMY